jgi:hypothetical protein
MFDYFMHYSKVTLLKDLPKQGKKKKIISFKSSFEIKSRSK